MIGGDKINPFHVLVCGGRGFGNVPSWCDRFSLEHNRLSRQAEQERQLLVETLNALNPKPTLIIHGAASGADSHAAKWAKSTGIPDLPFKANWYPNGFGKLDKSAGPRRNQQMINEGKPDLVVAFTGGNGTADMLAKARAAGVDVIEVH